jgi:hypothetical protein
LRFGWATKRTSCSSPAANSVLRRVGGTRILPGLAWCQRMRRDFARRQLSRYRRDRVSPAHGLRCDRDSQVGRAELIVTMRDAVSIDV